MNLKSNASNMKEHAYESTRNVSNMKWHAYECAKRRLKHHGVG